MRFLKVFAAAFFICSCILWMAQSVEGSSKLWIGYEESEITVSVKDNRAVWQNGIEAKCGRKDLTDQIRLTHIGQMDKDGRVNVQFTVIDDKGRSAALVRTVRFSDYTPPEMTLLRQAVYNRNSEFILSEQIMVTDSLDGDMTDRVRVVKTDLDMTKAGTYHMILSVENSIGVKRNFTLTLKVV